MQLIYRVQVPNSDTSLYYNNDLWHVKDRMQTSHRHPSPWQDAALRDAWAGLDGKHNYIFGFSTIAQLKSWIYRREMRRDLEEAGFRVVVYQTDDYFLGDTQAVFRKSTAIVQNELRLTEI